MTENSCRQFTNLKCQKIANMKFAWDEKICCREEEEEENIYQARSDVSYLFQQKYMQASWTIILINIKDAGEHKNHWRQEIHWKILNNLHNFLFLVVLAYSEAFIACVDDDEDDDVMMIIIAEAIKWSSDHKMKEVRHLRIKILLLFIFDWKLTPCESQ